MKPVRFGVLKEGMRTWRVLFGETHLMIPGREELSHVTSAMRVYYW